MRLYVRELWHRHGIASPAPLSWMLASGNSLPPGLTLNEAIGVITGTSTTVGTYSFQVMV